MPCPPPLPLPPSKTLTLVQVSPVRVGDVLDAGRRRKYCTECRGRLQGEINLVVVMGREIQDPSSVLTGIWRPLFSHPPSFCLPLMGMHI